MEKQIYKRIFQEKALSLSEAKDFCLWIDISVANYVKFVLYDPKPLIDDIFTGDKGVIENKIKNRFKMVFDDCILSTITISTGKDNPGVKVPNMAYTIQSTAAKPGSGAGVLLYDIVMSWVTNKGKFLTPDRQSISNLAQNVWKYYFTKRKDVQKVPIDDIHNPVTKNKNDDGFTNQNIPDKDYKTRTFLNHIYKIKKPINYSKLVKNNNDFMLKNKKYTNLQKDLMKRSDELFISLYY